MIYASTLKIPFLYHYQSFDAQWLHHTITNNEIFMGSPKGFNDPWDCKPNFISEFTSIKDRDRAVGFLLDSINNHTAKEKISNSIANLNSIKDDPVLLKRYIDNLSYNLAGDINAKYKIYCLTNKPENALMWGHYTNKHTGTCLEFSTANEKFSGAIQVQYNENYPEFHLDVNDIEILITKAKDWEYESEFRLIAMENNEENKNYKVDFYNRLGFVPIPENSLTSIIVGCYASDPEIALLRDIIKVSGKNIKLKQAIKSSFSYKLAFKDL